jgi:hypothetical protein
MDVLMDTPKPEHTTKTKEAWICMIKFYANGDNYE